MTVDAATSLQTSPPLTVAPDAADVLDPAARECIAAVADWMSSRAGEFGLTVEGVHVYRWVSAEMAANWEVVVDVRVDGEADSALRLWEAASERFGEIVEACQSPIASSLALDIHWR